MTKSDASRPGGWQHRPADVPIIGPLDYVIQINVATAGPPLMLNMIFTDDGLYVPAIIRTPPGPGPFPAVLCMHGGSGGLGIPYLVDQVLNRGFVYDRLLAEGYAVCYTEGRAEIEWAYGTDIPAPLDHNDIIATFRYLQRQPYINPERIALFGISHGGELQMKLISEIREGPAALVPGEPAVIEYLSLQHDGPRTEKGLQYNYELPDSLFDMERVWKRIEQISPSVPILILGRDSDHLQGVFRKLYEFLDRADKNVQWASWDHPVHGYQFGPRRVETETAHKQSISVLESVYQPDEIQQETLDHIVDFLNQHV